MSYCIWTSLSLKIRIAVVSLRWFLFHKKISNIENLSINFRRFVAFIHFGLQAIPERPHPLQEWLPEMDKAIAFIRGQFHNGDAMGSICILYFIPFSSKKKKLYILKTCFFFSEFVLFRREINLESVLTRAREHVSRENMMVCLWIKATRSFIEAGAIFPTRSLLVDNEFWFTLTRHKISWLLDITSVVFRLEVGSGARRCRNVNLGIMFLLHDIVSASTIISNFK